MGSSSAAPPVLVLPLPEVASGKVSRLQKAMTKRVQDKAAQTTFANVQNVVGRVAVDPVSGDGLGFGGVFVPKEEAGFADLFTAKAPYFKFDKTSYAYTVRSADVKAILDAPDDAVDRELDRIVAVRPSLKLSNYDVSKRADFWKHFHDSGDEMFVIRFTPSEMSERSGTEIYRLDSATFEPHLVNDGAAARAEKKLKLTDDASMPAWTLGKAFWSRQGTYLVTTHDRGVRLWAGDSFRPVMRLPHANVQVGSFPRNEAYIATWDGVQGNNKIFIHSVQSGECLAKLSTPTFNPHGTKAWPYVCWSHTSTYLATPTLKMMTVADPKTKEPIDIHVGITVYELPSMRKVQYEQAGKKLDYFPFPGATFSWQPSSNLNEPDVLAIWTNSYNPAAPSRLTMLQLPTMRTLVSRNIFAVDGTARTFWSPTGEYCALVTHIEKKDFGKQRVVMAQLDVLTMTSTRGSLPVSSVTLNDLITVAVSESRGRLAVLMADHKVVFYAITSKGLEACGKPMDVPKEMNTIAWSPLGTHFVIASCAHPQDNVGTIWFGQCKDRAGTASTTTTAGAIPGMAPTVVTHEPSMLYTPEILHKDEHSKLRHVEWDPSDRYVATSVSLPVGSQTSYKIINSAGYTIWSSQGKAVYAQEIKGLHRFQWRPHPLVHMPEAIKNGVRKSFNKYSQMFDEQDAQRKSSKRNAIMNVRKQRLDEFAAAVRAAQDLVRALPGYDAWQQQLADHEQAREMRTIVEENLTELSVTVKPTQTGA